MKIVFFYTMFQTFDRDCRVFVLKEYIELFIKKFFVKKIKKHGLNNCKLIYVNISQ